VAYKIQHLKLTGILDQAIQVVKDNFGLLFTILLICWIPFQLLTTFLNLALLPDVSGMPPLEAMLKTQEAQGRYGLLFAGLNLIQGLLILPVTNAAVIYAVAERYLDRAVTAGQALKKGLTKIAPLIWTAILLYLAVLGGLILLIIPGILFALWFGLSQHVVVLENINGGKALSRSKTLVRPYLGTFLGLGIVMFAIAVLLQAGSAMIPQRHVEGLLDVVIGAGITLVSTAAGVVFYFSCRCAVENFDLEHLAASIDSGEEPSDRIAGEDA
jgi:hypothetical protein